MWLYLWVDMCLSPLRIPNPHVNGMYTYENGVVSSSDRRLSSREAYIHVPCGKCIECVSKRYNDLLQRVYVESLSSYVYLVTLTYNQKHVPVFRFTTSELVKVRRHFRYVPSKHEIYYCDFSHIQDMLKRVRKLPLFCDRDFRYLVVSEYGSERMRPHVHMLFFVGRKSSDLDNYPDLLESDLASIFKSQFAVNVGTRKCPIYEPLFDDRTKTIAGKTYSTFDCKLIRPKNEQGQYYTGDCSTVAGTVGKYVLSYVSKESRFEEYVSTWFIPFESRYGKQSLSALKRLLTCRCSYSHQLGFGFDLSTGLRVRPAANLSFHLTSGLAQRYYFYYSLPDDFDSFISAYPDLADSYKVFSDSVASCNCRYSDNSFGSLRLFLDVHPKVLDYLLIALKYEPSLVVSFLKQNRFDCDDSSLLSSVLFRNSCSLATSFEDSVAARYLSSAVENSVECGMVTFCVPVQFTKGSRYLPMCSYYKRFFVRDYHILRLYDRLGVQDYDQYLSLVVKECDKSRMSVAASNRSFAVFQEESRRFIWRNLAKMPNLFAFNKKLSIFAPDVRFFEDNLRYEQSHFISESTDFSSEDRVQSRCDRIRSMVDRFVDTWSHGEFSV